MTWGRFFERQSSYICATNVRHRHFGFFEQTSDIEAQSYVSPMTELSLAFLNRFLSHRAATYVWESVSDQRLKGWLLAHTLVSHKAKQKMLGDLTAHLLCEFSEGYSGSNNKLWAPLGSWESVKNSHVNFRSKNRRLRGVNMVGSKKSKIAKNRPIF